MVAAGSMAANGSVKIWRDDSRTGAAHGKLRSSLTPYSVKVYFS